MVKYSTIIFTVLLFACGGNGKKINADTATLTEDTHIKTIEAEKIIATGEGFIIEKTDRDGIILFGAKFTCKMAEVYGKARVTFPSINAQISNHGGVIAGPLTVVYLNTIAKGEEVTVIAGVPVKNAFKNTETGEFLEIPSKKYYKMACTAGMGETADWHDKMIHILSDNKLEFSLPILEVFTESRNGNMEMISKASLLYPIK